MFAGRLSASSSQRTSARAHEHMLPDGEWASPRYPGPLPRQRRLSPVLGTHHPGGRGMDIRLLSESAWGTFPRGGPSRLALVTIEGPLEAAMPARLGSGMSPPEGRLRRCPP